MGHDATTDALHAILTYGWHRGRSDAGTGAGADDGPSPVSVADIPPGGPGVFPSGRDASVVAAHAPERDKGAPGGRLCFGFCGVARKSHPHASQREG